MDFKVSYLDAGLTSSYFTDSEQLLSSTPPHHSHASTSPSSIHGGGGGGGASNSNPGGTAGASASSAAVSTSTTTSTTPQKVNRRYKTQLRDFLSTCRTKRKLTTHHPPPVAVAVAPPPAPPSSVDYLSTANPAVAVAAAYNLNNMYSTGYTTTGAPPDNSLSGYVGHTSNFHHQSLYENRLPYLATTDNLFHQYRPYYTDYHSTTPYGVSNGFLDISSRGGTCSLPTYESSPAHHQIAKSNDYACHQLVDQKYASVVDNSCNYLSNKCLDVGSPYMTPNLGSVLSVPLCDLPPSSHKQSSKSSIKSDRLPTPNSAGSSPAAVNGIVTPKMEDIKPDILHHYSHHSPVSEAPRQTVLMWGSGSSLNHNPRSPAGGAGGSNPGTPPVINGQTPGGYLTAATAQGQETKNDPLKSLAEMDTKWKPETPSHQPPQPPSPAKYYQYAASESGATEVWPTPHHQFYSYHHHHPAAGEFASPQINRTGVLCCPSRR